MSATQGSGRKPPPVPTQPLPKDHTTLAVSSPSRNGVGEPPRPAPGTSQVSTIQLGHLPPAPGPGGPHSAGAVQTGQVAGAHRRLWGRRRILSACPAPGRPQGFQASVCRGPWTDRRGASG